MASRRRAQIMTEEERDAAVEQMLGGDEGARNRLVMAHERIVRELAGRYVRRGIEKEELISGALCAVLGRSREYNPETGRFSTFVIKAATTAMIQMVRDERKHHVVAVKDVETPIKRLDAPLADNESATLHDIAPSSGASPEEAFGVTQDKERLAAAIERLPERDAFVIRRRYIDGASLDDVGVELGVGKSWICQIEARALTRLQAILAGAEKTKAPAATGALRETDLHNDKASTPRNIATGSVRRNTESIGAARGKTQKDAVHGH